MKLLLVGGGHAHVHLIKKLRKNKSALYEVTLISKDERQYYSGMASGYLEGLYEETDIYFDLKSLCDTAGIDFLCDEVIRVENDKKIIETRSGMIMNYDVISFDIGSDLAGREIDGVDDFSLKIKPLGNLKEIRFICETMLPNSSKLAIVGSGAAGMEIALAIKNLSDKKNKKYKITMIGSSNEVLKGYNQKMKTLGLNVLEQSRINLVMNERVKTVESSKVIMESGLEISNDLLIWAGGSKSYGVFSKSHLLTNEKGYMRVNSYLQSETSPHIFGAGDCIAIRNYDWMRKIGVYAVKEAPVLWTNINRFLKSKPMKDYKPNNNFLSIVSTGNKSAILSYNDIVLDGFLPWLIKNYIDRHFMRKHKR